jgi:hypothetical protein
MLNNYDTLVATFAIIVLIWLWYNQPIHVQLQRRLAEEQARRRRRQAAEQVAAFAGQPRRAVNIRAMLPPHRMRVVEPIAVDRRGRSGSLTDIQIDNGAENVVADGGSF